MVLGYQIRKGLKMEDVILHGDVYACLDLLDNNSIAVAITSPPYWKQRDYGFEGQVGQESTPEEYIGRLVSIFSKLRQKMREDGVFFLNIGDKYLNRYGKSHLLQIPYRLAFHLINNGWNLEDIIIWYKTNHMPSSVEDRFANTYEPILVFTKNKNSIYKKDLRNIVKIPLQQTPWKHTAVFPERLVVEMLNRVNLRDGDLILDPFAGTGTVATVVKMLRNSLFSKRIYSIMIEKGDEFIDIIKKRTGLEHVEKVNDVHYEWKPVSERKLPLYVEPKEILSDKHGEVFIANTSHEFLSILKGITTKKFKTFHREDALYFFGIKEWTIQDLYYIHSILYEGYVLRNMLVISNKMNWYPIFMFAIDSTKVKHKFYLDRVKVRSKTTENGDWRKENFIGMKVNDITTKEPRKGRIVKVIERYEDGFPKIALVEWESHASLEFILNPKEDELVMEGLIFRCPRCRSILEEPYDPIGENRCPTCGTLLWTSIETIPTIEEPREITHIIERLKNIDYNMEEAKIIEINGFKEKERRGSKSKFTKLDRINWGASPGARKLMLGEYFTKMRLYRIDQPIVACYLTILRKYRRLSVKEIINRLPKSYRHTVGHWFRKDMGGSIPLPEDIPLLKEVLKVKNDLLDILERTVLKLETVKNSIKGKNPGDFIEDLDGKDLICYLKKLYMPSYEYKNLLESK
jgi:site-specific DNA-methyltransferase (adenine-specific)